MTTLTNEEKLGIAAQHKRNLDYNKYNLELTLLEENAATAPNEEVVTSVTSQIAELNKKITAIQTEIDSLTE